MRKKHNNHNRAHKQKQQRGSRLRWMTCVMRILIVLTLMVSFGTILLFHLHWIRYDNNHMKITLESSWLISGITYDNNKQHQRHHSSQNNHKSISSSLHYPVSYNGGAVSSEHNNQYYCRQQFTTPNKPIGEDASVEGGFMGHHVFYSIAWNLVSLMKTNQRRRGGSSSSSSSSSTTTRMSPSSSSDLRLLCLILLPPAQSSRSPTTTAPAGDDDSISFLTTLLETYVQQCDGSVVVFNDDNSSLSSIKTTYTSTMEKKNTSNLLHWVSYQELWNNNNKNIFVYVEQQFGGGNNEKASSFDWVHLIDMSSSSDNSDHKSAKTTKQQHEQHYYYLIVEHLKLQLTKLGSASSSATTTSQSTEPLIVEAKPIIAPNQVKYYNWDGDKIHNVQQCRSRSGSGLGKRPISLNWIAVTQLASIHEEEQAQGPDNNNNHHHDHDFVTLMMRGPVMMKTLRSFRCVMPIFPSSSPLAYHHQQQPEDPVLNLLNTPPYVMNPPPAYSIENTIGRVWYSLKTTAGSDAQQHHQGRRRRQRRGNNNINIDDLMTLIRQYQDYAHMGNNSLSITTDATVESMPSLLRSDTTIQQAAIHLRRVHSIVVGLQTFTHVQINTTLASTESATTTRQQVLIERLRRIETLTHGLCDRFWETQPPVVLDQNGEPGHRPDLTYLRKHPPPLTFEAQPSDLYGVCDPPFGQGIEGQLGFQGLTKIRIPTPQGQNKVKVLCMVYSHSGHQQQLQSLAETWAPHCDGYYAASNHTDPSVGAIHLLHEGPEIYQNMYMKIHAMWRYAYEYLDEYDLFHIGGDDHYVIAENLRYMVSTENPAPGVTTWNQSDPLFLGGSIGDYPKVRFHRYCSGGAGYTLNKAALRLLVEDLFPNAECWPHMRAPEEDRIIAKCFRIAGIQCTNTNDAQQATRYHTDNAQIHASYRRGQTTNWYPAELEDYHGIRYNDGSSQISESTVTFHLKPHKRVKKRHKETIPMDSGMRRYHAIIYGLCDSKQQQ